MTEQAKAPSPLLALADRCEREEPSAHLDAEIALALGWSWVATTSVSWYPPGSVTETMLPAYTTSLDAAVTLVPEKCAWSVRSDTGLSAFIHTPDGKCFPSRGGKTAALRLCAAALRALAALEDK